MFTALAASAYTLHACNISCCCYIACYFDIAQAMDISYVEVDFFSLIWDDDTTMDEYDNT